MSLGDGAFRFEPIQHDILGAALLRDGGTARRWLRIQDRYPVTDITAPRQRRLLPLIEHGLRIELAADDVQGRTILREAYANARAEHERRVAWVADLLEQLTDAGIEAIVLKGLALASTSYPDPALRPMADVDLLVRPRALDASIRILDADGWIPRAPLPQNHIRRRRELDRRGPSGEKLDLHWHLHPAFIGAGDGISDDEPFFTRSRPLRVGLATARMLGHTDSFLHVLVHGAFLGWRAHPLWVGDAIALIDHGPELDADRFVCMVRDANVAIPVARALAYLDARFDRAPRFESGVDATPDITRLARRPLIRQRRIYAQVARWPDQPAWLRALLGPFAYIYINWGLQTMTWSRRRAIQEFPGWLADTWELPSKRAIPAAAYAKLRARRERWSGPVPL
jgi:hypothetical protein